MLSCKQASQLISQSLDRRLSLPERIALRMHLVICDVCRRFTKQMHAIRHSIRLSISRTEHDQQLQLSQQARQRISEVLDSASSK